jgi:hypothetical protein
LAETGKFKRKKPHNKRVQGTARTTPPLTRSVRSIKETSMSKSFSGFCPDFEKWPKRWMGFREGIPFGERIIDIFKPFIDDLIDSKYTEKTIKRHIDNLSLLGGEIIRYINMDPDLRNSNALDLLMENIGSDGGPCAGT